MLRLMLGHERPQLRLSQVEKTALGPIPSVNQRRLLYENPTLPARPSGGACTIHVYGK
jgi:hypothetical protein